MDKKISTGVGAGALVIVSVLIGIFFWLNPALFNRADKISQQESKADLQIYSDSFWGFQVSYPQNWHMVKSGNNDTYYFVSYNASSKEKELMFSPKQNELRVKVSVVPSVSPIDTSNKNDYSDGPLIAGEKSEKAIFYQRPLSGYEGNRASGAGLTKEEIDKGHSILQYVIRHYGYTYTIEAEPTDSTVVNKFDDFLSNFKFIKRIEFSSQTKPPAQKNKLYEDKVLGYSFEYSADWHAYSDGLVCNDNGYGSKDTASVWVQSFERPDCTNIDQTQSVNKSAKMLIFHVGAENGTGDLEKDAKNFSSCDASGPGGDMYCPEKDMRVEEFVNSNNIKGVKVHRKVLQKSTFGKENVVSADDVLVVYPLSSDILNYSAIVFGPDNAGDSDQKASIKMLDTANTFNYLQKS